MGIVVKVIDAIGVEEAGTPHQAVHFIAFREQELGQVRAVLPGDACDQSPLRHALIIYRASVAASFGKLVSGSDAREGQSIVIEPSDLIGPAPGLGQRPGMQWSAPIGVLSLAS